MIDEAQAFLHMDDEWMWRFFFLDRLGKLITVSTKAYFTRAEAEAAMRRFRRELSVMRLIA